MGCFYFFTAIILLSGYGLFHILTKICNQQFTGELTSGKVQCIALCGRVHSVAQRGTLNFTQNYLNNMGNRVLSVVMQKCTELLEEKLWTAPSFHNSLFS